MRVGRFPAAESFEDAFAAVEFEIWVYGEDVENTAADSETG